MREEEKIAAGILFCPTDPELKAIKLKTHNLNVDFNVLHEDEKEKRWEILGQMLGEIGEGSFLQGPITFHYGKHTKIGKRTFINFNFTVQDDASVVIGDHCDIGPNVTIVTPLHPMLSNERRALCDKDGNVKRLCYAKPVTIGNGCWICANVTICPGVTIGENTVIGAGSVVTEDIPAGSFAAGVPCRVIRALTEKDSMKYKPEILADNKVEWE
ncbi:sugar O-acetyltransferase [Lachnoclostridium sp. Marseille-P6806]|uniref:sugar O-acetyltransferase n=1 Tax=Lachnoclostridium sp. Marseille-P6806 TaxID=2364793 RepID=UPI0010308BEE|nr:sugar O-acetyltransferase [Lachnoclostridium sp. Marseille-P6806]